MEQLIWAFGSMLFMGMIFYFLPMGLTRLGKIIVALIGLALALGGIAATVSFSLWQAILLLVAFIFFVSIILDNRLHKIIYMENNSFADKALFAEEQEWPMPEAMILEEITQVELPIPTDSFQKSVSNKKLPDHSFENQQEMDEDIALLLNRELNFVEVEKDIEIAESESNYNYLAEIEDLLEARVEDEKVMIAFEEEHAIREFEEQMEHEKDIPELILTSKGAE